MARKTQMSEILKGMGMVNAFDRHAADFSGICDNIYVDKVIHKTYVQVAEKGTRAGAVTAVEDNYEGSGFFDGEIKRVYLDRPFIYMLIDCKNNIPFFIGTVTEV